MIRQLKYDFSKVCLQKKYWLIFIAVVLFNSLYALLLAQTSLSTIEMSNQALVFFRPVGWLLCCYVICSVFTIDYYYKTIKSVLPYAKNRTCYIVSKVIVSTSMGFLIFLIHFLSTKLIFNSLTTDHYPWMLYIKSLSLACTGVLMGVMILVSLCIFSVVITENEAISFLISMGVVVIMISLEAIEKINSYLPTMWVLTFSVIAHLKMNMVVMIITILIALLFLFITIKRFKKRDLFI